MKSRARHLAEKSVDAMLAAIEIYNKPSFAYREESFAILAVNAWELLLKARLLQLSGNRMASILRYERRRRADGSLSEQLYRVKSRSGNHMSVGLFKALDLLGSEYGDSVAAAVRRNLELLTEVRDNAVHFVNKGFEVTRLVQEVGTASVRNYVALIRKWFAADLTQYNFYLMPLAFVGEAREAGVIVLNADERRVVQYLRSQIAAEERNDDIDYSVALRMELKFARTRSSDAVAVIVTNDPNATPVTLTEENIRDRYPWDYKILTTRLRKRYADFKANQRYHDIRKVLEVDERFCKKRYLDPTAQAGIGKCFYNPNIVFEFDKHYRKRSG